jgi:hypothetical protein
MDAHDGWKLYTSNLFDGSLFDESVGLWVGITLRVLSAHLLSFTSRAVRSLRSLLPG